MFLLGTVHIKIVFKMNCSLLKTLKWEMMVKASDDEYDSDTTCCENSQNYETRNLNPPVLRDISQREARPDANSRPANCCQGSQENSTSKDPLDYYASSVQQNELTDGTNTIGRTAQCGAKDLRTVSLDKFERDSYFGFTDLSVPESSNIEANHRFESDFNFTYIYEEEQQACNILPDNNCQMVYYFGSEDMAGNIADKSLTELTNMLPSVEYFKAPLPVAGCSPNLNQLKSLEGIPGHFNEKENMKPCENYTTSVNMAKSDISGFSNICKPLNNDFTVGQDMYNANSCSGGFSGSSDTGNGDLLEVKLQIENFLKVTAENSQSSSIEGLPTILNVVNEEETNHGQIPGVFFEHDNGLSKNDDDEFLVGLTQNLNQIAESDPIKELINQNANGKVVRPCTPPLTLNSGVRRKVLPADKTLPSYKRKHTDELKVLPTRKCSSAFINPLHRVENDQALILEKPRRTSYSKGKCFVKQVLYFFRLD